MHECKPGHPLVAIHDHVRELEHHVELEEAVDGMQDVEDQPGHTPTWNQILVVVSEVYNLRR